MRRIATTTLLVTFLALATPSAGTPTLGTGAFPDLIVHDAVVLTLDPDMPTASAIAVTGDRFVAVGSDEDVLGLAGPSTTLIDLDGKAVTP
ncbi:MAG: amidohydrolase, partial [Actinomycetota bacterium]